MNEHHAQAATLVAIDKDPRAAIGKIERFLRHGRSQGEQVQSPAGHAASDPSRSSPEEYESGRIARAEECETCGGVEELGR